MHDSIISVINRGPLEPPREAGGREERYIRDIGRKKKRNDAKFKKLFLPNNTEAIEPQNLLKTETDAKTESNLARNDVKRKKESNSHFHMMKYNSQKKESLKFKNWKENKKKMDETHNRILQMMPLE
jgi:hypothetical protein